RFLGNINEVFFVEFRDEDGGNPGTHRRQAFFFQTADRQDQGPQRGFAGHGNIRSHRFIAEERGERGKHGDPGRGTILGHSASGHVHVNVHFAKIFWIHAQFGVAAGKKNQGSLVGWLHHFTNVSGEDDIAFPWVTRGFNV